MLLTILEALSYIWVLVVLGFTGFGYTSYVVNMRRVKLLKAQEAGFVRKIEELTNPTTCTVVTKEVGVVKVFANESYVTFYSAIANVLRNTDLEYAVFIEVDGNTFPVKSIHSAIDDFTINRRHFTIRETCRIPITVTYHIPKDMLA